MNWNRIKLLTRIQMLEHRPTITCVTHAKRKSVLGQTSKVLFVFIKRLLL